MGIKLREMKIKNFGKFKDFEIEYGDKITRLVGANGAGKTTIGLTGIWACLKGIAEQGKAGQLIGERFRFIGSEKSTADIELILVDEKAKAEIIVKNHITESSNKITFKLPKGYLTEQDWLENLLSVALMSAKNFSQLSPKAQALALGIDTEKHDNKIKKIKDEYRTINAVYRGMGTVIECDKVERVSVSDLIAEKDKIDARNRARDELRREAEMETIAASQLASRIKDLENDLKKTREELAAIEADIKARPAIEDDESTAEIVKKITGAEEVNIAANEWAANEEKRKLKEEKKAEMDANREELKKAEARRIKYIKGAMKVEVPGLAVDGDGGLMLDEKPIREPYFSKGELEVAIAKIAVAMNPTLKLRFLDDFELLDPENQKKIVEDLFAAGFQVITAEIKTPRTKKDVIVLRECEKV